VTSEEDLRFARWAAGAAHPWPAMVARLNRTADLTEDTSPHIAALCALLARALTQVPKAIAEPAARMLMDLPSADEPTTRTDPATELTGR
jgi:hypothetical protein